MVRAINLGLTTFNPPTAKSTKIKEAGEAINQNKMDKINKKIVGIIETIIVALTMAIQTEEQIIIKGKMVTLAIINSNLEVKIAIMVITITFMAEEEVHLMITHSIASEIGVHIKVPIVTSVVAQEEECMVVETVIKTSLVEDLIITKMARMEIIMGNTTLQEFLRTRILITQWIKVVRNNNQLERCQKILRFCGMRAHVILYLYTTLNGLISNYINS